MPIVTVTATLDAPADVVWPAVKTPDAFVRVAGGMMRYPAAERVDGPWRVGTEISGWAFLFRVIPFSIHHLRVDSIDNGAMTLVSDERGGAIRTWRHELIVEPIDEHRCRYTDRIEIDAGPLTPFVVGYAKVFYRYRQRRWRPLARLLASVATAEQEALPSAA